MSVNIGNQNKELKVVRNCDTYLIACLILLGTLLLGCTNPEDVNDSPQATIHLEKIIDKESQQPLGNNIITLRWMTPNGEIITTEQYEDQASLTIVMPADGSVSLFIAVEVPGYKRWENALRMNWKEDRPVYITVEMEREAGVQG